MNYFASFRTALNWAPVNPSLLDGHAENLSISKEILMPGFGDCLKLKIKKALGKSLFLCDSCKWDWRGACHNPQRPNATSCREYEKRGK